MTRGDEAAIGFVVLILPTLLVAAAAWFSGRKH